MNTVLLIYKIFDNRVTSSLDDPERIASSLAPDAISATTTNQEIVARSALKAIVARLTVQGVGSLVADNIVV